MQRRRPVWHVWHSVDVAWCTGRVFLADWKKRPILWYSEPSLDCQTNPAKEIYIYSIYKKSQVRRGWMDGDDGGVNRPSASRGADIGWRQHCNPMESKEIGLHQDALFFHLFHLNFCILRFCSPSAGHHFISSFYSSRPMISMTPTRWKMYNTRPTCGSQYCFILGRKSDSICWFSSDVKTSCWHTHVLATFQPKCFLKKITDTCVDWSLNFLSFLFELLLGMTCRPYKTAHSQMMTHSFYTISSLASWTATR